MAEKAGLKGLQHEYMKSNDINHFANYEKMISDKFKINDYQNQREIKTHHSCKRRSCVQTFAETFKGGIDNTSLYDASIQTSTLVPAILKLSVDKMKRNVTQNSMMGSVNGDGSMITDD